MHYKPTFISPWLCRKPKQKRALGPAQRERFQDFVAAGARQDDALWRPLMQGENRKVRGVLDGKESRQIDRQTDRQIDRWIDETRKDKIG